jgi:cell filamentation protein
MDTKDYTTIDKIYCYENTEILKNKLSLKNKEELEEAERYITKLRQMDLEITPIKGNFDLDHLKKIHKKLFDDIYYFAGVLRKVEISKKRSQFCYTRFLNDQGAKILNKITVENYYQDLTKKEYIEKIVILIGDLIHLHPFREGNGRAIREFIRELCFVSGYEIDYSKSITSKRLEAEILAYNCNYKKLISLLNIEIEKI